MPELSLLDRTGDTTSWEFNQPEYATDQFPVGSTMERKITLRVDFVDGSALTSQPVLVVTMGCVFAKATC